MRTLIFVSLLLWTAAGGARELAATKPEREGMSSSRLQLVSAMNERYTNSGQIAGTLTTILRNGKIVYQGSSGTKGVDLSQPIAEDDLFRIYSMTKPITAVAAMQLYEQGKFQLSDPVSKFLPELKDLMVLQDGELVPVESQMTMQQLLSHTAGFSYGFDDTDPVDQAYDEMDLFAAKDMDDFVAMVAKLPLKYQPGTRWHYSIAVDLTGAVVQRLSGQDFDDYLRKHIFEPLDMYDTFFQVPEEKMHRLLPNHYLDQETGRPVELNAKTRSSWSSGEAPCRAMCDYSDVSFYSGGGGLVSTLRDYVRFAEAMRDGELNGVRILGPNTLRYMRMNHVPASIASSGSSGEQPQYNSVPVAGFGFGLGFGLVTNTAASGVMGSTGEYYWGGAAGTVFWIDPVENIVVVSMMQLMNGWPSYRPDLRVATYQAISETYD